MPIIPELHDSVSSVMLALSNGVIGSRPVENETEWRFILPHLSCHTVHLSQFMDQTVSVYSVKRSSMMNDGVAARSVSVTVAPSGTPLKP